MGKFGNLLLNESFRYISPILRILRILLVETHSYTFWLHLKDALSNIFLNNIFWVFLRCYWVAATFPRHLFVFVFLNGLVRPLPPAPAEK